VRPPAPGSFSSAKTIISYAAAPTAARKHRPDLFCPAPPVVPLSTSAAAS